jgi:hypothetical protein
LKDLLEERKGLQGRLHSVQLSISYAQLRTVIEQSKDWKAQTRFTSTTQSGSGDVFFAIPSDYHFTLDNASFKLKLATTLGCNEVLDSFASTVSDCPSKECQRRLARRGPNHKPSAISYRDQHVFDCKAGGGVTTRHNMVAKEANLMFRTATCNTRYEPRATHSSMRKGGPDIEVRNDDEIFYVDVAIVNPTQATYIGTARDHPLTAAQAREDAKVRKYRNLSEQTGRRVVGAVMETTGALGPSFKKLIATCAHFFDEHKGSFRDSSLSHWSRRTFKQYWRQRLSIALARGNGCIASCIQATSNGVRRHASPHHARDASCSSSTCSSVSSPATVSSSAPSLSAIAMSH